MKKSTFAWYGQIEKGKPEIEQGDILHHCHVLSIPLEKLYDQIQNLEPAISSLELNIEKGRLDRVDLIVVSQSCDLATRKDGTTALRQVLLCAFHRHDKFEKKLDINNINQGRQPQYHLLPPCDLPDFVRGLRIIDFRNLYVLPIEYVRAHITSAPHLRLMPPYREHFSQAFARSFMRVGLPSDLEEEDLARLTP